MGAGLQADLRAESRTTVIAGVKPEEKAGVRVEERAEEKIVATEKVAENKISENSDILLQEVRIKKRYRLKFLPKTLQNS